MKRLVFGILLMFGLAMLFTWYQTNSIQIRQIDDVVIQQNLGNKVQKTGKSIAVPADWVKVIEQDYQDSNNWLEVRSFIDPETDFELNPNIPLSEANKSIIVKQKMENGVLYQEHNGKWIQQNQVKPHNYVLGGER